VFHRKRSSLQVSDANRLRARLDLIQLQVRGLVGDRVPVGLERVELTDDGWVTPQDAADKVRSVLGVPPGPVGDLVGVLESGGVAVLRRDLGTTRMDALMSWPKGGRPVVVLGSHAPGDRQRFTVAHELGHAVMHAVPREDQEGEADRFASQFLMPQQDIRTELGEVTVAKLARLKARWGVSMAALLRRARDLDTIGEAGYRRMNIEFSQAGYRTNEPVDVPAETPRLVSTCVYARLQEGETVSDLASDAWMTTGAFVPAYLDEGMVNDDDRAHD
jgi:Zn-dependent peptidase ImmA (M78 family)